MSSTLRGEAPVLWYLAAPSDHVPMVLNPFQLGALRAPAILLNLWISDGIAALSESRCGLSGGSSSRYVIRASDAAYPITYARRHSGVAGIALSGIVLATTCVLARYLARRWRCIHGAQPERIDGRVVGGGARSGVRAVPRRASRHLQLQPCTNCLGFRAAPAVRGVRGARGVRLGVAARSWRRPSVYYGLIGGVGLACAVH